MAVKYHTVTFLPEKKSIRVEHLKTIFETIGEENPARIQLFFSCGAEGICRKCKVRSQQRMGPLTATEKGCLSDGELARGVRLACQARVVQDSQVEIQYKRPFAIELIDEAVTCRGRARLRKIVAKSGAGQHPDTDMLLEAALEGGLPVCRADLEMQLESCRNMPGQTSPLWTAVFLDDSLVALEPGDTSQDLYAVAVDLGTNTVVVSLIDAVRKRKIAVVTDSNPQIELGDSYAARLDMVEEDELNLEILNEEIILRIDILICELCTACGIAPHQVYEILVAGATGMLHLFLMRAPSALEQQAAGSLCTGRLTAGQLHIRSAARAGIALLPVISACAGSDITAAILAAGLQRCDATTLLLDLGSSTKAVLYHEGRLCTSVVERTAVFDGSGLQCGMRPETGAIAGVCVNDEGDFDVAVIGESLARGVCGSGLLELAACLREEGILDSTGYVNCEPDGCRHALRQRLITAGHESAVLLYRDTGEFQTDIYVAGQDLVRLIEACARVGAMLAHLIEQVGIECQDISRVLVSGALGRPLTGRVLSLAGLLHPRLAERVVSIGNATKQGVQLALLDKTIAEEAEALARSVVFIPYPERDVA